MFGDFGSLAGPAAVLLGLGVVIGILIGRLTRPHGRAGTRDEADEARSGAEDLQTVLDEREEQLRASRAEIALRGSRAEILQLRAALASLADSKDVEIGRLETAAIEALESTIAAHNEHIKLLEEELRTAKSAGQQQELQLAEERNRTTRLQAILAERDALIARQRSRPTGHEAGTQPLR